MPISFFSLLLHLNLSVFVSLIFFLPPFFLCAKILRERSYVNNFSRLSWENILIIKNDNFLYSPAAVIPYLPFMGLIELKREKKPELFIWVVINTRKTKFHFHFRGIQRRKKKDNLFSPPTLSRGVQSSDNSYYSSGGIKLKKWNFFLKRKQNEMKFRIH